MGSAPGPVDARLLLSARAEAEVGALDGLRMRVLAAVGAGVAPDAQVTGDCVIHRPSIS